MTWVMSNLILVHLETVLVSVQDRWTVCAKHSIGSVIVLDTPDGRPSDEAQVEARFDLFGDNGNLNSR
jgi:hypothetical protein